MIWTILAGAFCGLLVLGALFVLRDQEFAREFGSGVFGIVTTPFFLEATVFFIGLSLVVAWNAWRQRRDGDGWVYLAEADAPQRDGRHPDAHDAVFTRPPEPEPAGLEFEEIEGLLALGAWDEAGEKLVGLSQDERASPRGLACRILLAEGLGHTAQAAELRALRPGQGN